MQELVIDRVERKNPKKEGGNPFFVVYGQDGSEMTSFDAALEGLGRGTRINVEPKVSGRHVNIAKWEMLEEVKGAAAPASSGPTPPGGGGYKKDVDGLRVEYELKAKLQARERVSIEGQSTLHELGEMIRAGSGSSKWATDEMIDLYTRAVKAKLEAFIAATGTVTAPAGEAKKAEPAKETASAQGEQSSHPEFKDGVALVNYAMKQGWKMAEIREKLSINQPTEITDIPKAVAILFPEEKPPADDPNDPDGIFK